MSFNDIFKPAALLGAIGAAAAGVAVGLAIGRDPQALRRFAGAAARGVGRAQLALAETTEEMIDMWEDLREQARRELEEARFEAAASRGRESAGGAAAATAATAAAQAEAPAAPASKRRAPRAGAKGRAGKAAKGAGKRPARKVPAAASREGATPVGGATARAAGTTGG